MQGPVVVAGFAEMFYLSGAFSVRIMEHDDYGRAVRDCSAPSDADDWCIQSNGSVCGAPCPPPECPATPVEELGWGTIKMLYR